MKNRNIPHKDDWQTPKYIIEELEKEFGYIDFDPCPHNPSFDGLTCEWGLKNFVNPPYSRKLKEAFIVKAKEEAKKGRLCILLLPVSTSTRIFHKLIWNGLTNKPYQGVELRFIHGRVKFRGYNTKGAYVEDMCGQHDSMLVIFDGRV